MRILQVINNLTTGGAQKLIFDAIPKFNERGVTVDLLLLNGNPEPFLLELEKKNCCTIYRLGSGSVYNPMLIFKILPYLRKYDIFHVHLFPALYWCAMAKMITFSKTMLVFTEHSTSNKRRSNWIYRNIDRFIYKRYKSVVTISTEVKLFLKKHLGAKHTRYRTIHNGVDFDQFFYAKKALRKDHDILDTETILIQVASFTPQKDQETLIKSIPFIDGSVRLMLLGEGHELLRMKELVSELDINDKVRFLGIRTDVHELLKMADIAILSSHHEGLSLSGLEAMASGTPLVASNVSGLKTLVHGAGTLFRHQDEIDLANRVNELIANSTLYEEKAAAGLDRAKKYELGTMIEKHIQLYTELCPK